MLLRQRFPVQVTLRQKTEEEWELATEWEWGKDFRQREHPVPWPCSR